MSTYIATFSLAFLGSLHCMGMCGGVAGLASRSMVSYQIGRLISYLIVLNAMRFFAVTASYIFEQESFLLASRFLLLGSLTLVLFQFFGRGVKIPQLPWAKSIQNWILSQKGSTGFSLYLGLFTLFLPCAWLYGVLMVAASLPTLTESVLGTVSFWLGTIPVLTFGQLGLKRLLFARNQGLARIALIIVCMCTAWVGWGRSETVKHSSQTELICH